MSISAPKFASLSSTKATSSKHRILEDSCEKWEVHVNLSNDISTNPNSITVIVRNGSLLIYIGRTSTSDGWIYDTVIIPTDVQYKALQTGIKGKIMMISAPKLNSR